MPLDVFIAMLTFSVAMAFTPGPNNIMLAASGVNFGFVRTVPHMIGITAGFLLLLVACGLGLNLVFAAVPALQVLLKIAGALYMLWLAFKVATAHQVREDGGGPARPLTFWQAAVTVLRGSFGAVVTTPDREVFTHIPPVSLRSRGITAPDFLRRNWT